MMQTTNLAGVTLQPKRPWALYAVIAYALMMAIPPDLSLPKTVPLGRFTLEGAVAVAAYLFWLALWLVAVAGLAWRRIWGYRLGVAVFGLHIILVTSNCLRWLADNHQAPLRMAFGIAIWPSLISVCIDALAIACLVERRSAFIAGRGPQATWNDAKSRYQETLGLRDTPNE